MSVRTVKGIIWLAVAIALALVFASVRQASLIPFIAACAVLVAAVLWYRRVIPEAEERDEQDRARMVAELRQVVLGGQIVKVKASSGILLLVLMGAIAAGSGYAMYADPSVKSAVIFVLSLGLTSFAALFSLPIVGKPALIIRREGVTTADLGDFSWTEVESVGIRSYSNRGVTFHSLHLYVPGLEARESVRHSLRRIRRRLTRGVERDVVVVPLGFASIPAPVVHALCHRLWNEHTGRTSVATTAPSQALIDMKRRADEQFEGLERAASLAQTNPEEAMRLLNELKQRFPPEAPRQEIPVGSRRKTMVDAMMAEMRTIDPRDELARKRVMDKHVRAEVRRGTTVAWLLIIVGFALVMSVVVLLDG